MTEDGLPVDVPLSGFSAIEAALLEHAPCEYAEIAGGQPGIAIYVLPTVSEERRSEIVELVRDVAPTVQPVRFEVAVASRARAEIVSDLVRGIDASAIPAEFIGASIGVDGVVSAFVFPPDLDLAEVRARVVELIGEDPGPALRIEPGSKAEPRVGFETQP